MNSDPFDAHEWNLLQTVAWIYTRDPALVRKCSDDADPGTYYAEQVVEGGRREIVELPGFRANEIEVFARGAELDAAGIHLPFDSMEKAEAELIERCRKAAIKPTGQEHGAGERQEIPPKAFSGATVLYEPDGIGPKSGIRLSTPE